MPAFELVIDALEPFELAHFWASALTGYRVRPYDDTELARLESLGLTPETDPSVPIDGHGPTIWFQKSASKTTTRNRLHLDLKADDPALEVERLRTLGASVRDRAADHTVMLDPEGNQFCVFPVDGSA